MKLKCFSIPIAAVLSLVASEHAVGGGPASDSKMAEDALAARVGRKDGSGRQYQRLSQMRERNQRLLNERSEDTLAASIVFETGMMIEDLVRLQSPDDVEIIDIEFKVPVGDEGQILTVFSGTSSLLEVEGDFSYRARMARALLKGDYQQMLDSMTDELRADRADVVRMPWLVYRIEMIGPVSYLVGLEDEPNVAAVLISERTEEVQSYQRAKAEYEEAHKTRAAIRGHLRDAR